MSGKILVTGSAGFIGFHLVESLLRSGRSVVGIDNINDYYDPNLKYARLEIAGIPKEEIDWNVEVVSTKYPNYRFIRMNIEDKDNLCSLAQKEGFDSIIHLAAQAGVRYSIECPDAYIQSNIVGFFNILELSRMIRVKHLVYASSSSVYGMNKSVPFSVKDNVDHPVSLYAATKKSNELMAHSYSHLYNIKTSGLRFFTVYGPWGRPDMAYYLFARSILKGEPIKVFNHGDMKRDFTYIDDVVNGIMNVSFSAQPSQSLSNADFSLSKAPYSIYNIGNNTPVSLLDFIKEIEKNLGKEAIMEMVKMQDGDVPTTWADVDDLIQNFNYRPDTQIDIGLKYFVKWFYEHGQFFN